MNFGFFPPREKVGQVFTDFVAEFREALFEIRELNITNCMTAVDG